MAQTVNVIPVELTELRAASTASGGTALTSTLALVPIPFGSDYLSITPRNFVGAAVARFLLNPYLTIFYTTDAGVTITDISDEMQDGDTTDVALDSFPVTGTGYFYVGCPIQFRGVKVDIGSGNQGDNNVVLTVKYWNGSWVGIADTDGTIGGTASSFFKDGDITWTVPSVWVKETIDNIGETLPSERVSFVPSRSTPMYWTRWEWDTAFDADTDVAGMQALNRSTAYAELLEGQTVEVKASDRRLGCVEALTNAGTANLVVNVGSLPGSEFES
ncbi:hypothetical protein LCGC14_1943800 [marine sediment metagenome]|uniref:Uncharacterized protein n=1 Tax=marine sediment metagenome TaxID=412755 RepID=A0A0F9G7X9_9ZZZZ